VGRAGWFGAIQPRLCITNMTGEGNILRKKSMQKEVTNCDKSTVIFIYYSVTTPQLYFEPYFSTYSTTLLRE